MKLPKTFFKRTLLVVVLVEFAIPIAFILNFVLKGPVKGSSAPVTPNTSHKVVNFGLPARLKIPKINVDAAVEPVGLTSKGDLDVPKGPAGAGWYNSGPRPGEIGSSVIDGHFGYKDHIPAVFDNLSKLHPGDKLYVIDEKGLTATFVVSELKTYAPDEIAVSVFRSSDKKAHLNLITCEGTWNASAKSYSNRLVVFADREI